MKVSRINYFDVAKGILVLLLLVHHLNDSASLHLAWSEYYIYAYKWQSIYTAFFMQAFFFISGYCSNFAKPFVSLLVNASKQLLLPIIIFSIINSVVEFSFYKDFDYLLRLCSWRYWFVGGPFWFLNALFFSKLVVWVYNKYLTPTISILLSIVLIFIGVHCNKVCSINPFCIFHALVSVLFVYLGYLSKEKGLLERKATQYIASSYFLLIIGIKVCGYDIPSVTAGIWITLKQVPAFIALAIAGTILALKICKRIKSNRFLEFWGRNSLIVYGTHYPYIGVVSYMIQMFFYPTTMIQGFAFILIIICITLVLCYITIRLLNSKLLKYSIGRF